MNQEPVATNAMHDMLKSAALGLAGLLAVLATFLQTQGNQDIRPVLIVSFGAFSAAGFCAPRRQVTFNWRGACLVILGGTLPAVVLSVAGIAFTDHLIGVLLAVSAALATSLGTGARALLRRGHPGLTLLASTVAFLAAVAASVVLVPRLLDKAAYTEVNREVTPFSVRTLEGSTIRSDAWRGRVVVLSYWATWCPPCQAEMPEIAALQRKYQGNPLVVIEALNAGYGGDTAQKARAFLAHKHWDLVTAIDDIKPEGHEKGEAAINIGLIVVPTIYIFNQEQRLVAIHVGYDSSEHLAATLAERINSLSGR
jgi:thiol-disulfide isomerase/thioredoxin